MQCVLVINSQLLQAEWLHWKEVSEKHGADDSEAVIENAERQVGCSDIAIWARGQCVSDRKNDLSQQVTELTSALHLEVGNAMAYIQEAAVANLPILKLLLLSSAKSINE
jgi:hypothetical protein